MSWYKRTDHQRLPPIDEQEYPPISGLEGPFRFPNGRVLYYDPREGKYYDRGSDMYLSREETSELWR